MKKILFTTAYSTFSQNTWKYVLRLAQYFEAEVTLMHVYKTTGAVHSSNLDENNDFDLFENSDDEMATEELNILKKFAQEHTPKQFHSIPLKYIAIGGKVVDEILNQEKEHHYDLIVMGTKTTRHFADSLFGSASLKVLAKARSPIFLIPPTAKFEGINKIAYATNFQPSDLDTIPHLLDWVAAFNAPLQIIHVYNPLLGWAEKLEKMQKLEESFKEETEADLINFQMIKGGISKSIEDYLVFNNIDMVALTTHERGFFSQLFDTSISNRIATKALVPILVFKEKKLKKGK